MRGWGASAWGREQHECTPAEHTSPCTPSPTHTHQATLLYGVLSLQRDFPGHATVPVEAVQEAVRQMHAEAGHGGRAAAHPLAVCQPGGRGGRIHG